VRVVWTETMIVPAAEKASVATESCIDVTCCGGPERGSVTGDVSGAIGTSANGWAGRERTVCTWADSPRAYLDSTKVALVTGSVQATVTLPQGRTVRGAA